MRSTYIPLFDALRIAAIILVVGTHATAPLMEQGRPLHLDETLLRAVLTPRRRWLTAAAAALVPLGALHAWAVSGHAPSDGVRGALLAVGYLQPVLTLLSAVIFLVCVGWGLRWQVEERAQRVLRRLADASFGVFLLHMALIKPVRDLLFSLDLPLMAEVLLLWAVLSMLTFGAVIVLRRVPGVRRIL